MTAMAPRSNTGVTLAFALILSALLAAGMLCSASDLAEDSRTDMFMEGSFGAVVSTPSFSAGTWLDLTLAYAGFGVESLTSFSLDPALAGTQRFCALYGWEWIELGTAIEILLVPYAFETGTAYLDLTIADIAADDPFPQTLLALLSLELSWFPSLAPSIEADVRTTLGPLSTAVFGRIGVVPFVWQESWFEIVVLFLDAAIGDQTSALLAGDLTAQIDLAPTLGTSLSLSLGCRIDTLTARTITELGLYPALTVNEQLVAGVEIDAWTFTASTQFALLPYRFQEHRIAAVYAGDHFDAHAAVIFSPANVALDAGFEVSFP